MENTVQLARRAMESGQGVLRLAPAWVPRAFCRPGRRLRLHPQDYYACGLERGGIDERWMASTTRADNGPGAPEDEGLSWVLAGPEGRVLLAELIAEYKAEAVGEAVWAAHRGWPVFAKFFDNFDPLAHHIHHPPAQALRVGQNTKPEMYFYPVQMNNYSAELPITFFGLQPGTTRAELRRRLEAFDKGDNGILSLARGFQLELDTGWDVPPGLLHAPGSLCTYEPQFASDISGVFQSLLHRDRPTPPACLWMNCPPEEVGNYEYLLDLLDWALNLDPALHQNRFMRPRPVANPAEMEAAGYLDEWICYKNPVSSARRLTLKPGKRLLLRDGEASGLICIEGHGRLGSWPVESPTLLRYGQPGCDEFFLTAAAAQNGVEVENLSPVEDLVLLRNFAGRPGFAEIESE